ncbi:AAA family ATPase [Pleurocapsales cyanobacterium LEGE 10410]|nr:AAA family ATPase [Pleurocapsales cyanobacterium LEGE 10410]
MLVGCLIRNFKVYENITFVPISKGKDGNFTVFTGNNGVGKSSVLEALNHFFYQSGWLITSGAKKDSVYIAPLFLIKKSEFNSKIEQELLDELSNYLWNVNETANPQISNNPGLNKFLLYKNSLKEDYNPEEYYLFLIGLKYPNISPHFATFDSNINSRLQEKGYEEKEIKKIYQSILDFYSYVYIPVESSIQDILRLESFELQELMDKDVIDEIDSTLNKKIEIKREEFGQTNGPKTINTSALEIINRRLDEFISEANSSIQGLSQKYSFSHEHNTKKRLTAQDIRDRIIEEYFMRRTLKKDGKLIKNLSSGEQRIALFDIAYSLLSSGKKTKRRLILAIDEPECSMHMTQCYRQFIRLNEISKKYGHQVLLTTHWYGFLPVIENGYLTHIEQSDSLDLKQLPIKSITSDQKELPDEISLKSIFDLVSSVIGMMRSETVNWLVCEGTDDQLYLDLFLRDKIDDLCLLPMGGIANVVKIYNYFYTPLNEKKVGESLSGKIICLVDTDPQPMYPNNYKSLKKNLLSLRRIQLKDDTFECIELNENSPRHPTVIEDLLDSKIFFEAITNVVNRFENSELKQLLNQLEVKDNHKYTGFSNELKSIKGKDVDSHERKHEIIEFISRHDIKYQVAVEYTKIYKDSSLCEPEWIQKISELFNK